MKKSIESIFAKNFARNSKKKDNTWNIRGFDDESVFYIINYGNTGCGVFKRGVQN